MSSNKIPNKFMTRFVNWRGALKFMVK